MARASYIWVVYEPDYEGDRLIAAFTVEHECVSYLHRSKHTWDGRVRYVYRMPDGLPTPRPEDLGSETDFLSSCGH